MSKKKAKSQDDANAEDWPTPSTKYQMSAPTISQHTKDLVELEVQIEALNKKIADAIVDLHEIAKVGRNPAAPIAKRLIAKLEAK